MVSESAKLCSSVLARIKPTELHTQTFSVISSFFISTLQKQASEAKVILGGSGAKDTWLAMSHDADIFVVFDRQKYGSKSAELSEIVEKWMKKAFSGYDIERIHGSRDYFAVMYREIRFEVVPILGIESASHALNITDISPLHSVWVLQNGKGLHDDIRLAKQFCRAQGVYGAESHIRGFSGYILEILVIYYGGFEALLTAACKWKMPAIVDVERYYPKKTVFFELNKSKLQTPLIVVDPVDKSRNASAALSDEKFALFISCSKKWIKSHDLLMFDKEVVSLNVLRKIHKKGVLLALEIIMLAGKDDVVGVKVLKAQEHIERALHHFVVQSKGCEFEGRRAVMWFILGTMKLSESFEQVGPPLDKVKFVSEFQREHPQAYERDGQLFARVKHPVRDLSEVVSSILCEKYVTERILSVEKVSVLK